MNATERLLPAEVQRLLDRHLEAVQRALAAAGVNRPEQESVRDEIQTQATEMLAARAAGGPATPELMRAVIAELDEPEAYGEAAIADADIARGRLPDPPARLHPLALWALIVPILAIGIPWVPLLVAASALSLVLGIVSAGDIRRHPERYYGLAAAVLGMWLLPLIALYVTTFLLAEQWAAAQFGRIVLERQFAERAVAQHGAFWSLAEEVHRAEYGPDVTFDRQTYLDDMERRHVERQGADVPFELPQEMQIEPPAVPAPGTWEQWVLDGEPFFSYGLIALVMIAATVLSIAVLVATYRLCARPRRKRLLSEA